MCTALSKGFWGSFFRVYILLIHLIEAAVACAFKDVLSFLPKIVFFQAVALGILSTKMIKREACLDAFTSHKGTFVQRCSPGAKTAVWMLGYCVHEYVNMCNCFLLVILIKWDWSHNLVEKQKHHPKYEESSKRPFFNSPLFIRWLLPSVQRVFKNEWYETTSVNVWECGKFPHTKIDRCPTCRTAECKVLQPFWNITVLAFLPWI